MTILDEREEIGQWHVRMDAKRKALDALSGGGLTGGYDIKYDTNLFSNVPHSASN
jgi:hypothetical protein